MNAEMIALSNLPGADLVSKGLRDLAGGRTTAEALLVLVARPRLSQLGVSVPNTLSVPKPVEHALYSLLEETHANGAHSQYNALIRRVVSFARALEREQSSGPKK